MAGWIVELILGLATAGASAGWISTLIDNKAMKKKNDAEGDQARIDNLRAVCDKQEAEIGRLNTRLETAEQRYVELENKYYKVLERQQGLMERISTLEIKLAEYEVAEKNS